MLDCIDAIVEYGNEGRAAFLADRKMVDAVVRNFEALGEDAKRMPEALRNLSPQAPWRRIAGFRDVPIHRHEVVDPAEAWSAVERDLPGLRMALLELLKTPKDKG